MTWGWSWGGPERGEDAEDETEEVGGPTEDGWEVDVPPPSDDVVGGARST